MEDLNGRVAIVTGAASGIGHAIASRLVAEGMRLVMTDRDGSALERVASDMNLGDDCLVTAELDVRDPDAVDRVAELAVGHFGELHVAVNSAGIVNGGTSWELPLESWHAVIDVNLWGVIHGVRSFVPRILASGDPGHVVNIASMAAVYALGKLGPYTVAKHGVLGLSDVLRADLLAIGAPVGVSAVFPGRIRTGMNPIGTVDPSTVAANVLDAIRRDRPYVFTDDHSTEEVKTRLEAIIAARSDVLQADA